MKRIAVILPSALAGWLSFSASLCWSESSGPHDHRVSLRELPRDVRDQLRTPRSAMEHCNFQATGLRGAVRRDFMLNCANLDFIATPAVFLLCSKQTEKLEGLEFLEAKVACLETNGAERLANRAP